MEQGCTSRFTSLIDQLLVEDLSPRKMGELHGHLSSCPACQQRYNRVVLAARLLDGGPEALKDASQRELDWVGQVVVERTRLVPDSQPARRGVLRWVVGLAGAAAAVAIALPLVLSSGPPTPSPAAGEFATRGTPAKVSQQVGVRAFCIQRQKAGVEPVVFEASSGDPAAAPTCEVSDILRFAYTNKSKMSHLFLVGLDRKYNIKWYEPHPPKRNSIKVQQRVVDEPLSRAVSLRVNHEKGPVRLFAIFSSTPLHADQITQAVAEARRTRAPLERLRVLPLDDTDQRSILINLAPR